LVYSNFPRNITQNNRNRKKLTIDAQAKTKIRRLLNEIVLFSFYNDQNKKDKKTNNDLQNTAQNTRDYETRTSHTKPGVNSVALEG
jgi:hypothetical protein